MTIVHHIGGSVFPLLHNMRRRVYTRDKDMLLVAFVAVWWWWMITRNARLSIQRIPHSCLHVQECQERYPDRVLHYINLLKTYPDDYAGFLAVTPSLVHQGLWRLSLPGALMYCAW